MGLSRRKFTREVKEAAVRRLELGASVGEVARACEVNPNVLHRWRREVREFGGRAFLRAGAEPGGGAAGGGAGTEGRAAGAGDRFFAGMLAAMSKSSRGCKH
jgi:transposase-like protein